MHTTNQPLVSCIMPTYNRRRFVPCAIQYFFRQEYANKELIIIDDGTDDIADLIPGTASVKYYRLHHKISLGAKLNLACKYAAGSIIANWDDDDWYAPRRLTYQVNTLLTEGKALCGINRLLYYDLRTGQAYQYVYPPDQRTWLLGSSLCYTRELWSKNNFADIDVGMDGLFVWATAPDRIKVLADPSIAVHMIHDSNVSPKKTDGGWWHNYPSEEIHKIVNGDWAYYDSRASSTEDIKVNGHVIKEDSSIIFSKTTRNVYACLVHEKEDCVIDLVRNLHFHDPASAILLYNGGADKQLLKNSSLFRQFGAVIHPTSCPVQHGYLHRFALDTMQFALDNFSFDTITYVDSDQLCIRPGYSNYITQFIAVLGNTGMFSNKPKRVTAEDASDPDLWPAIQALKEFDLWKPFLKHFPNGESQFVHWTFWPSAVFMYDAVKDLINLIKGNKLLQDIMSKTRIWATEEVILPTLIKLLGYEIAANPCSYDFVKYRKAYTAEDINCALSRTDTYWMHPIERTYEHPLRKHIREQFRHYHAKSKENLYNHDASSTVVLTLSLIEKIRSIEGWLSDREADLLIAITHKALTSGQQAAIVETGSYHGKATVVFGSMIKAYCTDTKVYAIDPHDGKLGAVDQGLKLVAPSFEFLKSNIQHAGVSEYVEIIRDRPCNVEWQKPVSLLFIDGLHDYPNVASDFWHFEHWIVAGGYVAFHDYADYYPGVQAFVDELLSTGTYRTIQQVESLIVLQKAACIN